MMLLWNEMDMMDTDIAEAAFATIVTMRQSSRTKASLDDIIVDLLAEETRLNSLSSSDEPIDTALIATSYKGKGRALSIVQCHFCHEIEHDLHMGKVIGRGHRKGELFVLDFGSTTTSPTCFLGENTFPRSSKLFSPLKALCINVITQNNPNKMELLSGKHRHIQEMARALRLHANLPKAAKSAKWIQVMKEEMDALEANETWDIVLLLTNHLVVGSKWVYSVKLKSDGSLDHYKARLVAQGFSQEYGIDYDETFAPIAKMTTVRTLIAISAIRDWDIFQMDIKNAFLNGDLFRNNLYETSTRIFYCLSTYGLQITQSTLPWEFSSLLGNLRSSLQCQNPPTEAEYRAMSAVCSEIVWLRRLLADFGTYHTASCIYERTKLLISSQSPSSKTNHVRFVSKLLLPLHQFDGGVLTDTFSSCSLCYCSLLTYFLQLYYLLAVLSADSYDSGYN
uniref:Reverse transcriptase Ty1/copia-type domain-containing protein n=1 Tax=Fagus sylvatica TaxID=28930 RepID=A0A2N9GWK4_FAGSY